MLSRTPPRLITSWYLKKVPHGTNEGVSLIGLLAGILGAATIAITSVLVLPICSGGIWNKIYLPTPIVWHGFVGTLVDSLLGGWFQATVMNPATGKVVESSGKQWWGNCKFPSFKNKLLFLRTETNRLLVR